MPLDRAKILFLDCQTTGMHPRIGCLLELAWILPDGSARSFLLRLPEGAAIPPRVQDVTSITVKDMEAAVDPEIALSALETDLEEIGEGALLVVHYAQFERAFLEALFAERRGHQEIPARFLCTFKIAKKLFPQLPSRNIRALMGYFELGDSEIRRASAHAAATAALWRHLEPELGKLGIDSAGDLEVWLAEKKPRAEAPAKIEYRMDRLKRLELPSRPGVYRMLTKDGRVLYVGKATSLKSRVNSYFRGQKGRERKKLEMLAQVWDIAVTECETPLEAALLESDEIKRLDPPYNVSLRTGRRRLVFYDEDFCEGSLEQDENHPVGPFLFSNAVDLLRRWEQGLRSGQPAQVFYEPVVDGDLLLGHWLLCARHGLDPGEPPSVRQLLALGIALRRARAKLAKEEVDAAEAEEETTDADAEPAVASEALPLTPEEVADRYESLLERAAREYLRAKKLTRLLYARVALGKGSKRILEVRGGKITTHAAAPAPTASPWRGLGIADYDRMSILLTEIARHAYPVETLPPA